MKYRKSALGTTGLGSIFGRTGSYKAFKAGKLQNKKSGISLFSNNGYQFKHVDSLSFDWKSKGLKESTGWKKMGHSYDVLYVGREYDKKLNDTVDVYYDSTGQKVNPW